MVQLKINRFLKLLKNENSIFNSTLRNQLFACIIVNILTFAHGIALGWTTPVVRQIISEETPLSFPVTLNEASWMASIMALGGIVGNLVFCNIIDFIGRKLGLFFLLVPNVALWILIYFAPNIEILCMARFIGGFCGGGIVTVLPIFICEIADVSVRGIFQSFFSTAINFGILIGFILASKVDYFVIPLVLLVLPFLYFSLLFYFPETPQHLLRKNKEKAALESFCFYKNCKEKTTKLLLDFQDLKAAISNTGRVNKRTLKDFFNKSALSAYATGFVLLILSQVSGLYAIVTYMSNIFEISGAPIPSDSGTIITGVVQIIGNLLTIIFIDRCGRKFLLILSSVGTILGLIAFGSYAYFKEQLNLSEYSWIPLVLMIFIIFIGNIGIMSVTITLLVEILPTKIRSTAFSVFLASWSVLLFGTVKVFPIFMVTFGISLTTWMCAFLTTICLIYVIIFLPETKNKSMESE